MSALIYDIYNIASKGRRVDVFFATRRFLIQGTLCIYIYIYIFIYILCLNEDVVNRLQGGGGSGSTFALRQEYIINIYIVHSPEIN